MSTITTFLKNDRILCDQLFERAGNAVKRRVWRQAGHAIDRFAEALGQHLAMEEDVLFKALVQYTGEASKPIAALLLEHRQLRRLTDRARSAIRRRDSPDFLEVAAMLRSRMAAHCSMEEGIILLMADQLLRPAARFIVETMRSVKPGTGIGCASLARAA
jgi:hemerythrin-like domain-containing protein